MVYYKVPFETQNGDFVFDRTNRAQMDVVWEL